MNFISHAKESALRDDVFIGYVIHPFGIETERDFKEECRNTCSITVVLENGSVLHNIKVPERIMIEDILSDWPAQPKMHTDGYILGPCVILLTIPRHNVPVVVAVLKSGDKISVKQDGEQSMESSSGLNSAGMAVTANSNDSNLNLHARSSTSGQGNVTIQSSNAKQDARLLLRSNNIITESDKLTHITSEKTQLDIFDSKGIKGYVKLDGGNVSIDASNGIQLGEKGSEPAVKGDKLVSLLKQTIDEINQITVPTAFGPSGVPINSPKFMEIKNNLDTILSDLVKIGDKGANLDNHRISVVNTEVQESSGLFGWIKKKADQVKAWKMEKYAQTYPFHKEAFAHLEKEIMDKVISHFNLTRANISYNSGIRTPERNYNVGGVVDSQHLIGEALDFQMISGATNKQVYDFIKDNLKNSYVPRFHQLLWYGVDKNKPDDIKFIHVSLNYPPHNRGNNRGEAKWMKYPTVKRND